jgi:hypothetical protein
VKDQAQSLTFDLGEFLPFQLSVIAGRVFQRVMEDAGLQVPEWRIMMALPCHHRKRQDGHHRGHQRAAGAQGRPGPAADHRRLRRSAADRLPDPPTAVRPAISGCPNCSTPEVAEIPGRLDAEGPVCPLDEAAGPAALQAPTPTGIRSVAIAFMHAYLNPAHEIRAAEIAREIGFTQISPSHEASRLIKLVGRGDTAVVDAYLSPILRRYVGPGGRCARSRAGLRAALCSCSRTAG